MATAKLLVLYPMPKDMAAFEGAYSAEHIPMAAPIFQAAGATKAVLTKILKIAPVAGDCMTRKTRGMFERGTKLLDFINHRTRCQSNCLNHFADVFKLVVHPAGN